MPLFLYTPTLGDGRVARRVDIGTIAAAFAEAEEPARRRGAGRGFLRLFVALLVALLAIGDTVMVTHSEALGGCPEPVTSSSTS